MADRQPTSEAIAFRSSGLRSPDVVSSIDVYGFTVPLKLTFRDRFRHVDSSVEYLSWRLQ